ncbi:hypothetical protein EJ06DRAFT_555487 [Trichodelitschia bisporula]|uniref:Uncharacterized protein n=1 Tax=Trichodelitschia bisporula TaxID=703511 RepID=A0A6G1I1J7_9PEZI|nr:hypothetical protein EJ06DRAFT_555487 [Trichodelitschia bisporula]
MSQARAPALPQVERTEDSPISLVDVDTPHVSSVPSTFSSQDIQTTTQADRLEREAAAAQRERDSYDAAKAKAKSKKDKASQRMRTGAENPIVLGNAVLVGLLGTALGVGAYRKWTAGQLSWKVAGAWAGVVGLFAAGDYYVSQFLFRKYPQNK